MNKLFSFKSCLLFWIVGVVCLTFIGRHAFEEENIRGARLNRLFNELVAAHGNGSTVKGPHAGGGALCRNQFECVSVSETDDVSCSLFLCHLSVFEEEVVLPSQRDEKGMRCFHAVNSEVGERVVHELCKFEKLRHVTFEKCPGISDRTVQPLKDKGIEVALLN